MPPSPPPPPSPSPPVAPLLTPQLVGLTSHSPSKVDASSKDVPENNFYQDLQWTPDGTGLIAHTADQTLTTFILPPDLLTAPRSHHVQPYATLPSPSRVQAYTCYPHYNLQDALTTLILSSPASLPLQLTNTLYPSTKHATYSLIHPATEDFIAPASLRFTRDGRHFVAGCRDELAVFDVSRDGSGPVETYRTTVSRKAKKLYRARSLGCSGKIMALDISAEEGLLAAGTTNREVAIYDHEGRGECVTAFGLAGDKEIARGTGVMQVLWTPDARYLLVAERQSNEVQVFDIRGGFRRLCRLTGRKADTTQRMRVDAVQTADGCEVWAGCTDGLVRMWKDLGAVAGEHGPDFEMKMHNGGFSPSFYWFLALTLQILCRAQSGILEERYWRLAPASVISHLPWIQLRGTTAVKAAAIRTPPVARLMVGR